MTFARRIENALFFSSVPRSVVIPLLCTYSSHVQVIILIPLVGISL